MQPGFIMTAEGFLACWFRSMTSVWAALAVCDCSLWEALLLLSLLIHVPLSQFVLCKYFFTQPLVKLEVTLKTCASSEVWTWVPSQVPAFVPLVRSLWCCFEGCWDVDRGPREWGLKSILPKAYCFLICYDITSHMTTSSSMDAAQVTLPSWPWWTLSI